MLWAEEEEKERRKTTLPPEDARVFDCCPPRGLPERVLRRVGIPKDIIGTLAIAYKHRLSRDAGGGDAPLSKRADLAWFRQRRVNAP